MITSRKPAIYLYIAITLSGLIILLSGCKTAPSPSVSTAEVKPQSENAAAESLPVTATITQGEVNPKIEVTQTLSAATPENSVCSEMHGRIEHQTIQSAILGEVVDFSVYLPPCYDVQGGYTSLTGNTYSASWRYPVLWMMHGQTFDDGQWLRLGISDAADELIDGGVAPPFIIVLPYEKDSMLDSSQSPYGRVITDEIMPWVDEHYLTCTQRICRAAGGLSRGGAWALQLGFSRWDLFASIGAHSAPPFQGYPVSIPQWISAIPQGQIPRIYMDAGRSDIFLPDMREMEAFLTQLNVPHEWVIEESGEHDEAYWASHVDTYLRWYAQLWAEAVFR